MQYYCTTALSNIAVDGPSFSIQLVVLVGALAEFTDKPKLGSFRLKSEKIGTKRTKVSDELGSAHGQYKFEGTMPGGAGVAESRE